MLKSLNKARQDNDGKELKHFEVMDTIYQRVRNKTNDGLLKIEPIIKNQAHALYYEKKADLYTLLKEKKRQDDMSVERLYKKT